MSRYQRLAKNGQTLTDWLAVALMVMTVVAAAGKVAVGAMGR
jgi:hypothetical protein